MVWALSVGLHSACSRITQLGDGAMRLDDTKRGTGNENISYNKPSLTPTTYAAYQTILPD